MGGGGGCQGWEKGMEGNAIKVSQPMCSCKCRPNYKENELVCV